MPYLIIFLSLIFTSCGQQKKMNELSSNEFKSGLEQKSFLTITDVNSIFYFRGKVLNSFVEEKFPSGKDSHQIKARDELMYTDISERDMAIYSDKEINSAKVIVSYSDRIEIFFLPENVPLEIVASKLNLRPENEKTFRWVKTNITKTYSGAVLYLVSLNIEDVIQNDQNFFKVVNVLGSNYTAQNIQLRAGQILELSIDYKVLVQQEAGQQFEGRGVNCTRDLREADACGKCFYTRNIPSGGFNKTDAIPVSELGLSVKIGEQTYGLNHFKPQDNDSSIKFDINASDYVLRKEVEVQLISIAPAGITKQVAGYNYTGFCRTTSDTSEIGLARKVEAVLKTTFRGRGREFLKNVL